MTFQLDQAVEVLARTPATLHALLSGLSPAWTASNYGPDTFSPFDVVGHLIHGERTDWLARVRLILTVGVEQTFEPFDREAMFAESRGKYLSQLLSEFAELRRANLADLASLRLTPADLDRLGRHPAFGPVTLRQLLATWVAHDLNHVHQVAKCMAWQYREEIGPWRAYLGVYPREGA